MLGQGKRREQVEKVLNVKEKIMEGIQLQFGDRSGQEAKMKAMQQVEAHTYPGWIDTALDAVRLAAQKRREFVADNVWDYMPTPNPQDDPQLEPRAMGAVMARANRLKWIEPTGFFKPALKATSHRRPCRIWRSLIYNQIVEMPEPQPRKPSGSLPR